MSEYSEYTEIIEGQIITGKNNKDIEIEQLKELLKECQSVLANYKDLCGDFPAKNIVADRVLTKIDNAIGEK